MAKEKEAVGHHDSYLYPTVNQFSLTLPFVLKIVSGQADDMTVADKAKTLHTAASFALGSALPHEDENNPVIGANQLDVGLMTQLQAAAHKENKARTKAGPVGAWDWTSILALVFKLIQELVKS